MSPIAFSDEELDSLTSLAAVLPPSDRSSFLQQVAGKLSTHKPEERGPGLVHRLAAEIQRTFLRTDQVAVGTGGKYGHAAHLHENRHPSRERRRRGSSA